MVSRGVGLLAIVAVAGLTGACSAGSEAQDTPLDASSSTGVSTSVDSPVVTTAQTTTTTTSVSTPVSSPPAVLETPSGAFPQQPDDVGWPTEQWVEAEWPSAVDRTAVDAATDLVLADGALDRLRGVLIVYRGAVVYERYSPNAADGPDVVMPSYSIAKSVTSAMIGTLVRDGVLDIDAPAPVPEWQAPGDPRSQITVEHMLHMATGMPWDDRPEPGSDVYEMTTSPDMAAYAVAQEPIARPGEEFIYNTGTSTLLARMVSDVGGRDIREMLDTELFEPLGMSPVETLVDRAGTWAGGLSVDTTLRSFAKFGLLYARGGWWDGARILPESWIEFTRAPSPAEPEYGAHWWLDSERTGVMYAVGFNGQVITVDPAHDLVIVQLATVGGPEMAEYTDTILDAFAAAEPASSTGS